MSASGEALASFLRMVWALLLRLLGIGTPTISEGPSTTDDPSPPVEIDVTPETPVEIPMPTPLTKPEALLTRNLSDAFLIGLAKWGFEHKTNPRNMLAVSAFEAGGVNPAAANPAGAYGLFQWTEASRAKIGWLKPMAMIASLSSEEQLPLIDRYFRAHAPYGSIGEVYGETFLPGRMAARGRSPDTVLTEAGEKEKFYESNRSLDADKNGKITIGDLEASALKAVKSMGPKWTELMARIAWAESTLQNPGGPPFSPWPVVAIGVGVGVVWAIARTVKG